MKVGLLTSSRADYSIYLPLIKNLLSDKDINLEIIAFGSHLSERHGFTIDNILNDGIEVKHRLSGTLPERDEPVSIAMAISSTVAVFSKFWNENKFDFVFALGDRFEMFAACLAGLPFNLNLAHIHGGERTEGAIDDALRHSITHMSKVHFTSAEDYRQRVIRLTESKKNVFNVGALSFENLENLKLLSIDEFKEKFNIDLSFPSILITFHPETVSFENNKNHIKELTSALNEISGYRFIITMPNQDTMGNTVRAEFQDFIKNNPDKAFGVESFGTLGYLSCMKHCSFLLGNSSSGFGEASYFPKYVVNLGNRQNGRIITSNINSIPVKKADILKAVQQFSQTNLLGFKSVYGYGKTSGLIMKHIKELEWSS
jgi:GDP/UDP-N,N'-diacetylbacillosamine 2-epimerase (hydrolysing)